MTKIHLGKVEKGKFRPYDPVAFRDTFYLHEGKDVEVVVRRKRNSRSTNQNAYYHGVVIKLISNATGYEHDEAHDAMRAKFLVKRDNPSLVTLKSTSSLSTVEFEKYLENIRRFASQYLDCYIPLPNESEY